MIHGSRCAILVLLTFVLLPTVAISSQDRVLLGACSRDSLLQDPFAEWFTDRYEGYHPNPEVMERLKQIVDADVDLTIFFGSWCGDSKREVPRFLKILDTMSFPMERVELIAVSGADSVKKQSPQGQEKGKGIYRVPTIIVERGVHEINRIVEYPVESLERDLLKILGGEEYVPNYRSFPLLSQWLHEGLLADDNVSARGLANQLRALVSSEGELSAAGYVLMGRGQNREAVKVFEMNVALFPDSANRRIALARGLHAVGDDEEAQRALRRALELDEDHRRQDDILDLLAVVQRGLQDQAQQASNDSH
jgi:tetratricopeptide (TPR) repeat protein